jgi:hypothetical protein
MPAYKKIASIPIRGKKISARLMSISIDNLIYDEFNPRISLYRDSHLGALGRDSLPQEYIQYSLQTPASYTSLKNSIIENNGAMFPLWVCGIGKNKYLVIEGNTRLAIYNELHQEHPKDPAFKKINCFVLSYEIDANDKDFIRLTAHLNGQTPWDRYEQAKYLYILWEKKRHPIKYLAKITKLNTNEICEDIEAYKIMENEFSKIIPPTDRSFVHRFSYFKEFVKNKKLKVLMGKQNLSEKDFCKWVAEGKLGEARDVRGLNNILNFKETRDLFLEKDFSAAIEKLKDVVPEKMDVVYKLISELTSRLKKMPWNKIKEIDPHKKRIIEELKKELNAILRAGGR